MLSYIFSGIIYFVGLILLLMPPGSTPYFDPTKPKVRLGKHAIGLVLFATGTMRIHRVAKEWTGYGFVLMSSLLVLGLALLRVYREKST